MTRYIRRRIGQLIMAGFEGTSIPVELRSMAREFQLGGVILFGRNVEEPAQIAELSHDAQQLAADLPLWVSVDQEGGRSGRPNRSSTPRAPSHSTDGSTSAWPNPSGASIGRQ